MTEEVRIVHEAVRHRLGVLRKNLKIARDLPPMTAAERQAYEGSL
jgi:hypothetical protein